MRWYDPWDEMRRLQNEMDRIFGTTMRPRYKKMLPGEQEEKKELMTYSEPAVDVIDSGTDMKVMVDLPGIKKEDLTVVVREKTVHIKAVKKTETVEEEEGYFFQERGYQGYERIIPLPEQAIPEETHAQYNNGVLELTIKKANPSEKHEFKVEFD